MTESTIEQDERLLRSKLNTVKLHEALDRLAAAARVGERAQAVIDAQMDAARDRLRELLTLAGSDPDEHGDGDRVARELGLSPQEGTTP